MRKNSNSSLGFRKLRPTTQKILLLLMGGVALGLTKSPKQYFRIIKGVQKNWEWINHIFDIPEKFKKSRDALSRSLKRMGFYQLQKSVLVHPFECGKEIDFMVEFFNIHKFVRRILAENIDNELDIKTKFNL